ncbi:MAG: hypothetical protein KF799_10025 [Bdellovibrionales bacterium]|nr:hypothetical protein [Bdellovibrionales bacterium]
MSDRIQAHYRDKIEMSLHAYETRMDDLAKKHSFEWRNLNLDSETGLSSKQVEFELRNVDFEIENEGFNRLFNLFPKGAAASERLLFINLWLAHRVALTILAPETSSAQAAVFGMAFSRLSDRIQDGGNPPLRPAQTMAKANRRKQMEARIVEVFDRVIRDQFKKRPTSKNQDVYLGVIDPEKFEELQATSFQSIPLRIIHKKSKDRLVFRPFGAEEEWPRTHRMIEKQISAIKVEMFGSQKSRKR